MSYNDRIKIIELLKTILKSLEPFMFALAIVSLSLAIAFVIWFAILLRKEDRNQ